MAFLRRVVAVLVVGGGLANAKIIPRRDPLDGALNSSLIVIMKQQQSGVFKIEEVFLGDMGAGQLLDLPRFKLAVRDESAFISGVERVEPIRENTRILAFLKPAKSGGWDVAGLGNCYFWTHDPNSLEPLQTMARRSLALRASWESARSVQDGPKRVEALWPFLWNYDRACYKKTMETLREIGPDAGDYIAQRLATMPSGQKQSLVYDAGVYRSHALHAALIVEMKEQKAAWEKLIGRQTTKTYDQVSPPGRMRNYPPRPDEDLPNRADEIYGLLYSGFEGLGSFNDRSDLPFIRESAMWAVRFRFKQIGDAALEAFARMPDRQNLPVIQAVWQEFSKRPFAGNEMYSFDVMKALNTHRYPEAIPLMAQFANVRFAREMAHEFLASMTGMDFGSDVNEWLHWYESHKDQLGLPHE
jgi:hypothetical protein